MAEIEPVVTPKPRPIVLIGMFLVDHSALVSVLCFAAGMISLLLLPVLAKNTYISENALMPGSASPMLSNDDALDGNRFMNEILKAASDATDSGICSKIQEVIAEYIAQLGGEVCHHRFHQPSNKFHPLHFFLGPDTELVRENHTSPSHGVNTVGILRAPRGDGKEAIVIVTPYNSSKITTSEALSLGISYSVFSLLARVTWLAKDIVWLAADSKYGEYASVVSWLKDYHSLSFGDLELHQSISTVTEQKPTQVTRDTESDGFRRAGTMAAALVIKVADSSSDFGSNVLNVYAEASNGQMPNLDMINIVNYLAAHGQGMKVQVDKVLSLVNSWWLNSLGQFFEFIGQVARTLNTQWKFGISAADYVEGSATLASSLYNQALGVPTGPHGAFRDYQVDAVTLEISPSFFNRVQFFLRVGRLVEGVIRSVNNLLEKFHQSFFLYLLTGPNRFVSVGVYMIPFALLVAPLPLVAAALYSDESKSGKDKSSTKPSDPDKLTTDKDNIPDTTSSPNEHLPSFESWIWLDTAKTVLLVHLWSGFVAQLPYLINQIHTSTQSMNLIIWISISILSLLVAFTLDNSFSFFLNGHHPLSRKWTLLKSVTVASAFIGLCLMSIINFATAQIGALMLVPLCLTIAPLRRDIKTKTTSLVRGAWNLLLVFLAFLPLPILLLKGASNGFDSMSFGDLWIWAESLWAWNSATYVYMCIVHLPCWVLCCHILLFSS